MKHSIATLAILTFACDAFAFSPSEIKVNRNYYNVRIDANSPTFRPSYTSITSRVQASNEIEEDCGCASIETIYTGKPSDFARSNINHRSAIANIPLYKIDGSITTLDDIIGDANDRNQANQKKTSLVVFMRSLG